MLPIELQKREREREKNKVFEKTRTKMREALFCYDMVTNELWLITDFANL
jgi:hypothetical protein